MNTTGLFDEDTLRVLVEAQDLDRGLAVDGGAEMTLRLKMASVPYAAVAGNVL